MGQTEPALRRGAGVKRGLAGIAILLVALALTICLSIAVGARPMSADVVVSALREIFAGRIESDTALVIWQLRVPRTVLGVLVGMALGCAGAMLQGHTRNPLADPNLLGISAGAALAVVIMFRFVDTSSTLLTVFTGFAGALGALVLVFFLTSLGGGTMNPISVVLGGAALAAVCSAITSGIVLSDTKSLDQMRFWTAGSLAGRDLQVAAVVAPFILIALVISFATANQLNLLNLGDDVAASLGVNVNAMRNLGIGLVAVLAGAAVAACGPIGFVGLVVPHIVRGIIGADYRWVLPCAALAGACLLLLADVAGRVIARPGELEVGITLAFVGAPFALALLSRTKQTKL